MTIWLASGNKHKLKELTSVLVDVPGSHGLTIKLPAEAGITGFDPEETGTSFAENALIKAKALYCMLNADSALTADPVLADDSGLCVDALGGRPGIYSARYYGKDSWNSDEIFREGTKNLTDQERNALLLEELDASKSSVVSHSSLPINTISKGRSRSCRFVCAMVLLFSPENFYLVQETLEGEIVSSAREIRGRGGFGYDPIVYLPELGRTVAELSEEEKNRLSHRGKAGKAIAKLLGNSLR
jgi:XTP/dITP diphosphohydrolase